jgi:hypothetical protein
LREGLKWKAFLRHEKSLERKARQPAASARAYAEARTTGGTPRQEAGNRNSEQMQGAETVLFPFVQYYIPIWVGVNRGKQAIYL